MIRVAQWAIGAVGREAVLGVLDAPGLELVGARVHDPARAGLDVGPLVGRKPIGVSTVSTLAELLASRPDVVVYTPRTPSVIEVCDLLAAGVDVVTTSFGFHPARTAHRDQLAAACARGGSSLHGSGLNPGNFSAAVPLAITGLVRRLEKLTLRERADWSVYESTGLTFDLMRFGSPPAEVDESVSDGLAFNAGLFREQVWLLGDALRADLDEVVTHHAVACAPADVPVFDRVIRAGTVNAQWWRWTGRSGGEDRVEIECRWTVGPVDPAQTKHWPEPAHGWTLTVEGDPSVAVTMMTLASHTKRRTLEDHVRAAMVGTAMQVVNAIPHVHAAAPGFVTAADLPVVKSLAGFGG